MICQRHVGMMHGIADLALFGEGSLILGGLMNFIFHQVLVKYKIVRSRYR